MSMCIRCKQEMLDSTSCVTSLYLNSETGEEKQPIRFGDETVFVIDKNKKCHDCRTYRGGIHHKSCDVEECPFCYSQLLSCDCGVEVVIIR